MTEGRNSGRRSRSLVQTVRSKALFVPPFSVAQETFRAGKFFLSTAEQIRVSFCAGSCMDADQQAPLLAQFALNAERLPTTASARKNKCDTFPACGPVGDAVIFRQYKNQPCFLRTKQTNENSHQTLVVCQWLRTSDCAKRFRIFLKSFDNTEESTNQRMSQAHVGKLMITLFGRCANNSGKCPTTEEKERKRDTVPCYVHGAIACGSKEPQTSCWLCVFMWRLP